MEKCWRRVLWRGLVVEVLWLQCCREVLENVEKCCGCSVVEKCWRI